MIVIEALSLKDTATIPFGGESVEMNTQEGWAKKVEKNLQLLSQNNGNFSIIGVYDDLYEVYDLIVGDLVCISDIKDTYQSGFIYEIMRAEDYTAQNGIVGVVIDVKESSGSVEYDIDGKYYTVAFKGAFLLDSFPFSGNIYYNYTTHELTTVESGNLFVGKYINDVLVIENEMCFDVEVYIPSAMNISDVATFTKTKQLNFVGENVVVSGNLDPAITTNVTILGQKLSLKGTSYDRFLNTLNFESDEITIDNGGTPNRTDIILAEYPFLRDDDESLIYSKHSGDISTPLEGDSFVVGSDNLNVDYARKMFFNKPLGSFGVGELLNVTGFGAFSTGSGNTSIGDNSQSFGVNTQALTNISFSSGFQTTASGNLGSHAEGNSSVASGDWGSHAEGFQTTASGDDAHSEGWLTQAIGNESHAEGHLSIASGESSHAEGEDTSAGGDYSHAEGYKSIAEGGVSHAEGQECTATGGVSHAEGYKSIAEGGVSHAEGYKTEALETASHAEGYSTIAQSEYSHAEGKESVARYTASHAFANGKFSVAGDAQGERLCGKCITINESVGEILNIQLPDNSIFGIEGNIIMSAPDLSGVGFCKIKILCKCISNTITIVDETKEDIYGGIETLISSSAINNDLTLSIQYIGSITTFYWVGTFNITELIIPVV
jgi:hypothetical protein